MRNFESITGSLRQGNRKQRRAARARARRGSALIPALLMLSVLSVMGLSFLSASVSGKQVAVQQNDDYNLRSTAESASNLAADTLWAGYLRSNGGAAGDIAGFRTYLEQEGVVEDASGPGIDLLPRIGLPASGALDHARVDSLRVRRRDQGNATQLYFSVSTSTQRGEGVAHGGTSRAVEVVYNVEPAPFDGFDYAILTRNVNCVFCHTRVDNAARVFNHDGGLYDSFAKVKVGTLTSLELRSDSRAGISDSDADALLAGTLYVRGVATNQAGIPISNWGAQSAKSCTFDNQGHLIEDGTGHLTTSAFSPSGNPPQPGANLYLNYPTDYGQMVDGGLPADFPPPFPDDGGIDPSTGHHSSAGAGNKHVDPNEFYAAAEQADGTISGGTIFVAAAGQTIATDAAWQDATSAGNTTSLAQVTTGNVVLTGTEENPLVITGTVAIDGDVVIQGVVKGKGSILAKGNLYVPGSLTYADGQAYLPGDEPGSPSGPRTFGVAQDGTINALGLAAGGNMMVGDYLDPTVFQNHDDHAIVDGTPGTAWNFTLAEIAIFNRSEWSYTQPTLPGPHGTTVTNPKYKGADYVPRFYQFGPGDVIPIFNLGGQYFDPATGTWRGPEAALSWDPHMLTLLDPNDHTNPLLYDQATGEPRASVLQSTSTGGWLSDQIYENAMETWKDAQPNGTPMKIDGLLYTNNAIFGIVHRSDRMQGQLEINGSLVCADLGLLAPGKFSSATQGTDANLPGSPYKIGLRLNYDGRTKDMLNVQNPNQVTIKRALWTPVAAP